MWRVENIAKVNKMPTEQDVTSLVGIGQPVKVIMADNKEWSIVSGETVFRKGSGDMELLAALADARSWNPTAAAAAAGGRRKTRKSRARKTRRYRK